jgi:hypothetical protein
MSCVEQKDKNERYNQWFAQVRPEDQVTGGFSRESRRMTGREIYA